LGLGQERLDLPVCSTVTVPVTVSRNYGFEDPEIDLRITGLPAGVTAAFDSPSVGRHTGGDLSNRVTLSLTAEPGAVLPGEFDLTVQAASGPLASQAILHVTVLVPHITGFSPGAGSTPMALQPGTDVVLTGDRFAPGMVVQFGNQYAQATPTSISPDGTTIHVRVPRLATDGPLTLISSSGCAVATSSASFTVHSFRNTDGFAFANRSLPGVSYDDIQELFGYGQTHLGINLCFPIGNCTITTPIPDPLALLFTGIASAALNDGQCSGFALASQRLARGDEPIGGYPPQPGLTTGTVWDLQGPNSAGGPSAGLLHYIHIQHVAQLSSEALRHYVLEATAHAVGGAGTIRSEITSALLGGDFPRVAIEDSDGHEVIAYNLEDDGHGGFDIDVYNPNVPFVTAENTNADTHRQNEGYSDGTGDHGSRIHVGPDGHWSFPGLTRSGQPWNGPASLLLVTPYWVVPVHPTIPSSLEGIVTFFGSSSQSVQVMDSSGHYLLGSDGTLNIDPATHLPEALRFFPGHASDTEVALPLDVLMGDGPYTEMVRGTTAGVYQGGILGDSFGVSLDGTPTAPDVVDTLTTDARAASFQFQTAASSKPLSINLMARAGDGAVHAAHLQTMSLAGGSDRFAFDAARQAFSYKHSGPATSFTLTLSSVDSSGRPVSFASPKLTIGPGDTVTFKPSDWRHLDSTPITLSLLHADGRSESVDLSPQGRARAALVTSLYQTLLGRAPTTEELVDWSSRLTSGESPRRVATAIYRLRERRIQLRAHVIPRVALNQALKRALAESGLIVSRPRSRHGWSR
jgi:hypothetical protein